MNRNPRNYYPIWDNKYHGPLGSANDLSRLWRVGSDPVDVIFCADKEGFHLVTRLRKLGYEEIAQQLEGAS
jgi:hypothetical protein